MSNTFKYLIFSLIFFLLGYLFKFTVFNKDIDIQNIAEFQSELNEKETIMVQYLDFLKNYLENHDEQSLFAVHSDLMKDLYRHDGISFLIYENDSLQYWSANSFPIPRSLADTCFDDGLISTGNGYFLMRKLSAYHHCIYGLIEIKWNYPFQNQYLKNEFQKGFNFPSEVEITNIEEDLNSYPIYNLDDKYVFSLQINNIQRFHPFNSWLLFLFYLAAVLSLFYFFFKYIDAGRTRIRKQYRLLAFLCFLLVFRYLSVRFNFLYFISSLKLFSPQYYASSNILPSLGDYFLNSIFVFFFFLAVYQYFSFGKKLANRNKVVRTIIHFGLLIFLVAYIFVIIKLFQSLIFHSNIVLEAHRVLEIDIYSYIALLSIGLHFAAFVLLADKTIFLFKEIVSLRSFILRLSGVLIVCVPLFRMLYPDFSVLIIVYFLIFIAVLSLFRYGGVLQYTYSRIVLLVVLISIFSAYFILKVNIIKERENKQVLAVNLANERDAVSEVLFKDLTEKIQADRELKKQLFSSSFNYDEFYNSLKSKYFSGYLNRYDMQLTICSPNDSVIIEPDDEWFHCYGFFKSMIHSSGIQIPDAEFFYLENPSGRISYLGQIQMSIPEEFDDEQEATLFVELQSKIISEELGYPELLIENSQKRKTILKDYSYAKYYHRRLISKRGDFSYKFELMDNDLLQKEYTYSSFDGYDHLVYRVDQNNIIFISRPSLTFLDAIISFSYIFLFYYIIVTIFILAINLKLLENSFIPTFQNRIQFSMIFVLLISFVSIGVITILLSTDQYKNKHNEIMSEKMQSVYIELMHKLEFEDELTKDWYSDKYGNLDDLLQKFSNVFYTDINLYDKSGDLLATSRPDVFTKQLIGEKMNPEAFYKMVIYKSAEFIHKEKIGDLTYLSGYTPFFNNQNKILAYLNLPYFTKQEELAQEISALVVTIINIYVLLILFTTILAYFSAEKITRPLRILKEKFSQIILGHKNEQIEYNGKDEIAAVVKEYNRMVVELTRSIELLAKSERELAWREMAKQIAHEIKNPLTPMKLSVQQLQRFWKDKPEKWEEYLEKFTTTMIDQINSLSAIATEFSNFAQMPKAQNEKVNVIAKIKNAVGLFENTRNVNIITDFHGYNEIYVFADKEQLLRVFVNLLKNAIQSIPEDREGIIRFDISKDEELNQFQIKLEDNGSGIPDDLQDKLFQPNFTTKSSGMGLGLAIVKNIIEGVGGSITFKTELNKGSVFIVRMPVYDPAQI